MATVASFPVIAGGCVCNTIRYRLLTFPLYCFACHCPDCQKLTGSAFGLFLSIELYNIKITSSVPPALMHTERKAGVIVRHAECPTCHVHLWADSAHGEAVCNVRVGTLDFPSLMEPDAHIFVESKLDWIRLPDGAKAFPKGGNLEASWPRSSVKRLDMCARRTEQVKQLRKIAALRESNMASTSREEGGEEGREEGSTEEASQEGDKTPTALEFGEEDDEAFEKRLKETERALQERLEKLTLKLNQEEDVTEKRKQTPVGV